MRRGATDAVMVSCGDTKSRRACLKGLGSSGATLPMSYAPWSSARLGEVCVRVTSGGTPSTKHPEYYGGEIPWLRTQEVDFSPIYSTELSITDEGLEKSSAKWIPQNSVIIAMYGATAGRSAITKIPITTNQACCNLVVDDTKADYRFVYYSLKLRYSELEGLAKGSAQTNLSAGIIKEFEIPLPPLPIQCRIADILSAYDDLIENNRRRIAILEEAARLAYRKWLKENNNSLKSTRIGDLIELQSGFAFKSNTFVAKGKYKIITIKNVKDVVVDGENVSYVDDVPERMPQHCYIHSGDILLSLTGNVGRVSVSIDEDGLLNQRVAKVKSDFHWFSLLFLTSTDVFCRMNNLAVGAAQQNLSPVKFCNEMFELPERSEMALINELVEPLFEQIVSVARFSSKLAAARDMLLPRLMKGDVA